MIIKQIGSFFFFYYCIILFLERENFWQEKENYFPNEWDMADREN